MQGKANSCVVSLNHRQKNWPKIRQVFDGALVSRIRGFAPVEMETGTAQSRRARASPTRSSIGFAAQSFRHGARNGGPPTLPLRLSLKT